MNFETEDEGPVVGGVVPMSAGFLGLLAGIAGLGVAALYYSQPMLAVMAEGVGASQAAIGLVPMLTQLGYALGILLLAPLGDRIDRRKIIMVKAAVLTGALAVSAAATNIVVLLAASLVIGLMATLAQDVVSGAASLAPEGSRGRVVGAVMTGLLLGILLSRVVSGFVAQSVGWRTMFVVAAVSTVFVLVATWRWVPRMKTTTVMPYAALLGSLWSLWRKHAALRRATWAQALLAVGFSAFWSSLALMLHGVPFYLGSAAAGAFGLAGAAGAVAAPLAGRLADRKGPELVTRLGAVVAAVSFGVMALGPLLSPHGQLWLIGLTVIGFDMGVQVTLIAHQSIIYSIEPEARSRLNAVLFTGMFIGMAVGAGLSGVLLGAWGWSAVTGLAVVTSVAALALRFSGTRD
ncbi:MAG: MFS transporter [Opitutaceae bacterium]